MKKYKYRSLILLNLIFFLSLMARLPVQADVTLYIESWRSEDIGEWEKIILPAFQKKHKDLGFRIKFRPSENIRYNHEIKQKLANGTAGDLIFCRAYDISLNLYRSNHLLRLNGLPGLQYFNQYATKAWTTDDGRTTYCLPVASVIHGFIYSLSIFKELNLKVPQTNEEFFKVLEKIKNHGKYIPLVLGTADQWESNELAFQNIGPNYWKGEEGRLNLIAGKSKFTDQAYVSVFENLSRWRKFLSPNFEAQTYVDSKFIFTSGQGAILPTGSFYIREFIGRKKFEIDAFPPPVETKGDECYISDHTDMGIGINTNSSHIAEAKIFLNWLSSKEFAELYSNVLPGFYSLSKHQVGIENPLARKFLSWRNKCKSTIRNDYQILSREKPKFSSALTLKIISVLRGQSTPKQAAEHLQKKLEKKLNITK